jgi:hypothetical protein
MRNHARNGLTNPLQTGGSENLGTNAVNRSAVPFQVKAQVAANEPSVEGVSCGNANPLKVCCVYRDLLQMLKDLRTPGRFDYARCDYFIECVMTELVRHETPYTCSDCGVYDTNLLV